jgi:hypothetical protein
VNCYGEALHAIQISHAAVISYWPIDVVRELPEFLVVLLDQKEVYSLERLQLVSISVEVRADKEAGALTFQKKTLSYSGSAHELLILCGDVIAGDNIILTVAITYFVRGQRKYMKTSTDTLSMKNEKILLPITSKDVETFFAALKQGNNFLFDKRLSQLNGRMVPFIPTQMMYALFLMHTFIVMKDHFMVYRYWSVTFHKSICQGHTLKIYHDYDQKGFYATINADDGLALSLVATNTRSSLQEH